MTKKGGKRNIRSRSDLSSALGKRTREVVKHLNSIAPTFSVDLVAPSIFFEVEENPDMSGADDFVEEMQEAHEAAMNVVAGEVDAHLTLQMQSSWGWISGSRDIIETGMLMASGSVAYDGGGSIQIEYSSPYANLVHYGGYVAPYGNTKIDRVYIPGRPWIEATLGEAPGPVGPYDFRQGYMEAFENNM